MKNAMPRVPERGLRVGRLTADAFSAVRIATFALALMPSLAMVP